MVRYFLFACLSLLVFGGFGLEPASAGQKSIVVIGDSLADGLYTGMYSVLGKDVDLSKKTKINTGLVRGDKFDWEAAAKRIAESSTGAIAVVCFGANDLVSFRDGGKPVHYGDPRWQGLYGDRVAELVENLKAGNMQVFWVGIPISRPDRFQKDYAFLNNIFGARARAAGATYIDTWDEFAVAGAYSSTGEDLSGHNVVLRATDGVHFTPPGYARFGMVVINTLKETGAL